MFILIASGVTVILFNVRVRFVGPSPKLTVSPLKYFSGPTPSFQFEVVLTSQTPLVWPVQFKVLLVPLTTILMVFGVDRSAAKIFRVSVGAISVGLTPSVNVPAVSTV